MNPSFEIKTEVFEGPLDLLLNLIEKRKLLINDISLSKVTDDYINYVKNHGEMPLAQNSHFILIASTLLLIKSKSLLPGIELSEDEEQSIEDLEKRLKIFKRMKDVEPKIQDMFLKTPLFGRRQVANREIVFAPSGQLQISTLTECMKSVINSLPKVEKLARAVVDKVISLEEMINRLTDRIKQGISMSFKDFSEYSKKDKVNVIVSFLALLELVKEGIIETTQKNHYDDIDIQTKGVDIPNYS